MEALNESESSAMMKQLETWLLSDEDELGLVSEGSNRIKEYETWLLSDEDEYEDELGMVLVGSDRIKEYETWLLSDEDDQLGMVSVPDEEKNPNIFPLDPNWLVTEEELPVGFRFKPTKKELLIHYLGRRLTGGILESNAVKDFDVYSKEPWLLPGSDMIRSDPKESLYFFVPYRKTSKNSFRAHRQAGNGFWKASTGDEELRDDSLHHMRVIGYVKQLTYHLYDDCHHSSSKRVRKTKWIMHEFKLTKSPDMTICKISNHKASSRTCRTNELG